MRRALLAAVLLFSAVVAGAQSLPFTSTDPNLQENLEWLANQARQNKAAIASTSGGSALNAGSIIAYASSTIPSGWLECDGSGFLNTSQPDLFLSIGCSWGCADATHFNVPDLRGRFPRGWDHSASVDPDAAARTALLTGGATGDSVGSYQADEFDSHTHTWGYTNGGGTAGGGSVAFLDVGGTGGTTAATGGNETRPKNAYVIYIIKATNASTSIESSGGGTSGAVNVTDAPILGTGEASNHIRLDPTGVLPAMDGSALTGVLDATKVAKAGDTMTGTLNGTNISMSGGVTASTGVFGSSLRISTGARISIGYLTTPTTVQLDVAGLIRTSSGIITVGGNARGVSANDLQITRNATTQVASGLQAVISGGYANTCAGASCAIGGGNTNNVTSGSTDAGTIGGGNGNTVGSAYGTIGGGNGNTVGSSSTGGTVGGGASNTVNDTSDPSRPSTVAGGTSNSASNNSFIGGGYSNSASFTSTVGGGTLNNASNTAATIGGGTSNAASGARSVVGGGNSNTASGQYSTVPGGTNNVSLGVASFATGRQCKANTDGSVAMCDNTSADFPNATANSWRSRFSGGYYFSGGASTFSAISIENNGAILARSSITTSGFFGNSITVSTGYFTSVGISTGIPQTTLDVNGNAQFGLGATRSTFTATGFWEPISKTKAQIDLLVPTKVGQVIDCSDCALPGLCRSTGTLASQWRKMESATLGCGTDN